MNPKPKPDCYECEYRSSVPGDAHSSCNHPAFKEIVKDPIAQMLGIFASIGRVASIQGQAEGIVVKGNKYGIQNGWFNHPFNFDPCWLEECTGFKQKK